MISKKTIAAALFVLLGATPVIADCGFEDFASDYSRVKVVTTTASNGTTELLTIPRKSREPWPHESYDITVMVYDAETCSPHPAARVWYKDNFGINHNLAAIGFMGVKEAGWMARVGRPLLGVFRLRAENTATSALVYRIHYRPASPLPPVSTPQTESVAPGRPSTERAEPSAIMLDIMLWNQASFSVTFEITDVVCGSRTVIKLEPREERGLEICSDGTYGKIIYRDIRNQDGVEASLLRHGDRITM